MTAKQQAGAASHTKVDWQAIDWPKVRRNVRRLQARIVKATQEGRWNKVKALQHLLLRNPGHSDRRFRRNSIADSGAIRSLIPGNSITDSGHGDRLNTGPKQRTNERATLDNPSELGMISRLQRRRRSCPEKGYPCVNYVRFFV